MRTATLLVLVLLSVATPAAPSAVETLRALEIPSHRHGAIEVFHEGVDTEQARQLAGMLERAALFFSREFDRAIPLALAVLDEEAWSEVARAPYGMPFVSGPPYVVVLPATGDHSLVRLLAAALEDSDIAGRHDMGPAALVDRFVSLIAFHELGHVYARETGVPSPEKWVFEFNATYLAYAFLQREEPEWGALWAESCRFVAGRLEPAHRSLDDFEALYVGVGTESYTWFQCVFLLQAADVFAAEGLDFIRAQQSGERAIPPGTHHLEYLEGLHPGFLAWAARHGLIAAP